MTSGVSFSKLHRISVFVVFSLPEDTVYNKLIQPKINKQV